MTAKASESAPDPGHITEAQILYERERAKASMADADAEHRRRITNVLVLAGLFAFLVVLCVSVWLVLRPGDAPVSPAGPPTTGPSNPGGCFDPTFLQSARSAGIASDLALAPLAREALASVTASAGAGTSVVHENKDSINILSVCDRQCWLWSNRPEASPERAQLFQDMRECFNRAAEARGSQPPAVPKLGASDPAPKPEPKPKRTSKPAAPAPEQRPQPAAVVEPAPSTATTVVVYVTSIQVVFHTQDDDKDGNDGVSETLKHNNDILGSNTSWGQSLVFRDNSRDLGEAFDVSARKLALSAINEMTYHWDMDNDDGWRVKLQVIAKLSDGRSLEVFRDPSIRQIGNGGGRSGEINLRVK